MAELGVKSLDNERKCPKCWPRAGTEAKPRVGRHAPREPLMSVDLLQEALGLTCTCHSPRATTTQEAEGNAGVSGRLNGRDKAKNAGFWFPDHQIFLKTMLSSAFPKSLAHKKRKCLLKILQRTTIQIQSLVGTCRVARANSNSR